MRSALRASVLVLCLLGAGPALATPYAGEFLSTGIGARPLGLGGAYVALVDDASATYWNPAALPRSSRRNLLYMHSERFGDLVNYDSGALVLRARERADGSRSAFGVGFLMVSVPDIRLDTQDPEELARIESGLDGVFNTNDPDGTEGNGRIDGPTERIDLDLLNATSRFATDRQLAFLLSYGRTRVLRSELSLGASAKFVYKSLDDYSAWGIGLDLGALYEVTPRWTVGLNIQDATTTFLDWSSTPSGEREYITPSAKLGTAYTREIAAIRGSLSGAVDLDCRFEREVDTTFRISGMTGVVRAGIEYWYRDTVALRFGTESLGGDTDPFTGGAGIRVKRFSFDYAYRNHSDLEDVHRISGGVLF